MLTQADSSSHSPGEGGNFTSQRQVSLPQCHVLGAALQQAASLICCLPAHLLCPPMLPCFSTFLLFQPPTFPLSFYLLPSNSVTHFPFQPPSHIRTLFNSTNTAFPSNQDRRVGEDLTWAFWVLTEVLNFSSHHAHHGCPPRSTAGSPELQCLAGDLLWAKQGRQHYWHASPVVSPPLNPSHNSTG